MSARAPILALVLLASLAARPAHATIFVAGFKGGFAVTDMTGFDDGVSSRSTFVLGGVAGWETNAWFTFVAEPSFAGQGGDMEGIPNSALHLNYFELPLLAKFKKRLHAESRTGPFGTVGPVVGINTQATLRLNGAEETATKQINDVDLGLGVGAGFDWDFDAGGILTLEARFIGGFLDITADAANAAIDQDVRNLALQLTVGWSRRITW